MPIPRWKTLGLPKPPVKVYRENRPAVVIGGVRPRPVKKKRPVPRRVLTRHG